MGERIISNILSKKEPKHNRSIYLQNGYYGQSVFLLLRYFKGGEFFNTLTDLEKAEITAPISFRCLFEQFYGLEGNADALIYEDENARVFATVCVNPDLDVFCTDEGERKNPFMHYLIDEYLYVPINEYVNCEELGCSSLLRELVARFVEYYNIQPFTKENLTSLEREFFSNEGQELLNESNNAFIQDNYCNLSDYSSYVTAFSSTPLGSFWCELRQKAFPYLNCVSDIYFEAPNDEIRYAPSYPLMAFDSLDASKPLASIASVLNFVPTEKGIEHYRFEHYITENPSVLSRYIKNNKDAIERLKDEFQRHTDIPLLKGVDEVVVMKVFALMHIAFEIRNFYKDMYARCRSLFAC